ITLHLGYGRERVGRVGTGVGFNAYALRRSDSSWIAHAVKIAKTNARHHLVATQTHHAIESEQRQVYRAGTLQQFLASSDFVRKSAETPEAGETLYDPAEHPYAGYKWGMAIDLTTCIGCN